MKGIVVFKFENKGSKSEGSYPYLYLKNAEFLRIWREGDCSLFGEGLKEFDGKYVSVEGNYNEYNIFIASKIEPAEFEESEKNEISDNSESTENKECNRND